MGLCSRTDLQHCMCRIVKQDDWNPIEKLGLTSPHSPQVGLNGPATISPEIPAMPHALAFVQTCREFRASAWRLQPASAVLSPSRPANVAVYPNGRTVQ